MPDKDYILARIMLRAAVPLVKVLIEDDPKMREKYRGFNKIVQFEVKGNDDLVTQLKFEDGIPQTTFERDDNPDLAFIFKSAKQLNAFFAGKAAVPKIKGFTKIGILLKVVPLLLGLTLLLPTKLPKDPQKKTLKVKLLFYMLSSGLSQMNKAGYEEFNKFTEKMPDRVIQWSCLPDGPYAYLRIKFGKTKAGRGLYTRRRPFIDMQFNGVDNAIKVLTNQVDLVQAIMDGYLVQEGSPEYGKDLGSFMLTIDSWIKQA
ncbi:MAG: hypothetical protein JW765_12090 [Deltaproteobacteria bacterium]|nr:hypothetical protein [Candidatus Zymogenaceae bacterium]